MGARRDLISADDRLHASKHVVSIALRRDFSHSPAYWVELYCETHDTRPSMWRVFIQWSFKRGRELVEDHTLISPSYSATDAVEVLAGRVDEKLAQSWLYHSTIVDPQFETHSAVAYLNEFAKRWSSSKEPEVQKSPETKTFEELVNEPETRAERFARLQRERKAKAEW